MSTPPRPWRRVGVSVIQGANGLNEAATDDEAERIVRAVNAFEALLELAKAAAFRADPMRPFVPVERVDEAIARLDAAHPDWRTW